MKGINIVDIDYIKTGDELLSFIMYNDYTPNLSEYETRLRKDHQTIVDKIDEIKKAAHVLINVGIFVGKDSTEDCVREIKSSKDKVEKSFSLAKSFQDCAFYFLILETVALFFV